MDDGEIYELIQSKNQNGLSFLLDKYGGLITYIVKNTGNFSEEDISECTSDILFAIWKRINKYERSKSSFKTWIIIVARCCAIDYHRRNIKQKRVIPIEDITELSANDSELDSLSEGSIIELLQQLPAPDNEIFYRKFVLGENTTEIAKFLDLTIDNIYKRISRGKEKLKCIMSREEYNDV